MTAEEIRDIAIDSAKNYYTFLDANERGVQEVTVHELTYLNSSDFIIKLRLSARLFDVESIFFKLYTNNRKYDISQVKIIEYDGDKNILLVKIEDSVASAFQNLRANDIKVISDLKFLIERVRVWYELNGANLRLPEKNSILKDKLTTLEYLEGDEPSENQKISLRNIFNSPFSYVWGAPGTGKTQFVLSYALLFYIRNNMKVAIMAPTNNAIEQVLRGVIKMTDKANIDREKIIRLGTPSRKFAKEYAEVCEVRGIQKKLEEIDYQIDIVERVIINIKGKEKQFDFDKNLLLFDSLEKKEKAIKKLQLEGNEKILAFRNIEIDRKNLIEKTSLLETNKRKLEYKTTTFGHRMLKKISSKPTKDETALIAVEEEYIAKKKDRDLLEYSYKDAEIEVTEIKKELQKNKSDFDSIIYEIKKSFKGCGIYEEIISDLNYSNWNDKKNELINENEKEKKQFEINSHLVFEYKDLNLEELQNKLKEYKEIRIKIASSSTKERLNSVNVIACTLDGYIGRYAEEKLNVAHIFLDEAGYANMIKALTLFNHDVPISFLGDHMQLPPVCEINDSAIQGDDTFKNMFLWAQSAICIESLFTKSANDVRLDYLQNRPTVYNVLRRSTLTSTFRFGNNLAKVLSRYVYENNFKSEDENGQTKIIVLDAPKTNELRSRISITEVRVIEKLTQMLKSKGETDYVILTPYKKQVNLLGSHLPEERNDLKILTVHGSQGREWDTVILSVVDTNDMWFVDSTIPLSKGLNLINTAVSRAKKELIIVCDKNYWSNQKGQLITDLIAVESVEL